MRIVATVKSTRPTQRRKAGQAGVGLAVWKWLKLESARLRANSACFGVKWAKIAHHVGGINGMARQCHKPKRDNLVDACGYIKCLDMILSGETVGEGH
jgi:hypothetical protein